MLKTCTVIVFLSFACRIFAQDVELPTDFRQHNLGQFNSSIWNPTFALDRNSPRSIALWSRWQWQSIDGDPSTLFLNYTQKINESLAGGIGFLQHNTGIFLQSGVYINAAWETALDAKTTLSFGANIFSFGQELANEQLILLPESEFQGIDTDNSFSTQISPGIRLTSATFSVGFTLQNAISIGLSGPNNASDTTVFQGFISNDFPLQFLGPSAYFRPQAYVNAVSGFDTQVGIVALVGHPNFWAQGGYNSFYGPSLGIGTTLAKTVSVGGLMEFATGDFSNEDPTFELVLSYFIGKQGFDREPLDDFEPIPEPLPTEEEPAIKEAEKTVVTPPTDVNNKKEAVPEEIKPKPLSKRQQARLEKRRRDSIEQVEKAAALIRAEKRRMDSINSARIKEKREKEIKDSIAQVKSREISLAKEQESKEIESKNEKVAEEVKPRTLSKRQQRRLEKRRLDSLAQAEKAAALMRLEKRRMDSINNVRIKERREKEIKDSIAQVKSREIDLAKEQARLDSIAAVKLNEDVVLLPNERYEEVVKGEGLEPGFYLIANVFGTKKYYENFMRTLKGRGLRPGSFYRKANGYNYVYLKRYNSINEARQARDSKFDGKYQDKLWIFRIR